MLYQNSLAIGAIAIIALITVTRNIDTVSAKAAEPIPDELSNLSEGIQNLYVGNVEGSFVLNCPEVTIRNGFYIAVLTIGNFTDDDVFNVNYGKMCHIYESMVKHGKELLAEKSNNDANNDSLEALDKILKEEGH